MYKSGRKLLILSGFVAGLTLGYSGLGQAMESKIPVNSPVVETKIKKFSELGNTESEYYRLMSIKFTARLMGIETKNKPLEGIMTYQTLENGVTVAEYNFGPGNKLAKLITQVLPDGGSVVELDRDADGSIESRMTCMKQNASILLFDERQLSDGSIEKEQITVKPDGSIEKKIIKPETE